MLNTLNWKKGLFSCTFQIFSGGMPVGELKDSEFSQSAYGRFKGRQLHFKTRGHLMPKTDIIDSETGDLLGQIRYNCWYPKAKIILADQELDWSFNNIWETKWSISDEMGERLSYRGWTTKGSIETNAREDLLVLAGLFIANYYQRQAAVILAVTLPLLLFWM